MRRKLNSSHGQLKRLLVNFPIHSADHNGISSVSDSFSFYVSENERNETENASSLVVVLCFGIFIHYSLKLIVVVLNNLIRIFKVNFNLKFAYMFLSARNTALQQNGRKRVSLNDKIGQVHAQRYYLVIQALVINSEDSFSN